MRIGFGSPVWAQAAACFMAVAACLGHAAEPLAEPGPSASRSDFYQPDIVMGSHSYAMNDSAALLDRNHAWSKEITRLYRGLLPGDYEYGFDPYWVSAYPYRVDFSDADEDADEQEVTITVRNFRKAPQKHRIELRLPAGVTAEPNVLEVTLAAESRRSYPVKLKLDRRAAERGVQIVPFDITLNGHRHGELFDFLIRVPAPGS